VLLLAAVVLAAGVARAQDDLPPGFKADPNSPFKDAEGQGSVIRSPNSNQNPGFPNGMQPGYPNGMTGGYADPASFKPPIKAEAEGAPIDSSQSVNATLSYVDHEVQYHMMISGGQETQQIGNVIYFQPYEADIQPGLNSALAPIVAKFGVSNLQEAIRLKPSPRARIGAVNGQLEAYELQVLNQALGLAMTAANPQQAPAAAQNGMPQNQNMMPPGMPPQAPTQPAPMPQAPFSPAPTTANSMPPTYPATPPPAPAPAPTAQGSTAPSQPPAIVLGPTSPAP
jgi:hypothetical protein